MKNILFFPLTKTNWSVMSRLALQMEKSGYAKPVLVISNKLVADLVSNLNAQVEVVELRNIKRKTQGTLIIGSGLKVFIRRLINMIKAKVATSPGFHEVLTGLKKREIYDIERNVIHVLDAYNPHAVVVAADRNSGIEPCVIKISKSRGIPTVIPPIAFAATIEGLLIVRRENPGHIVTHNHEFKLQYPGQWVNDPVSNEDVSFFSIPLTNAYNELKMLSPRPWIMGMGLTDWILADSSFVRDRYVNTGVPEEKIVITGHMEHDNIFNGITNRSKIRQNLIEKYKLFPEEKIIILPLPNWLEHNYMPSDWHWEQCEFLCHVASQGKVSILIPLHPTQKRENYLRLETKYAKVRVLEEPLSEVLGAADLYFTGLGSSTVIWAVMAAIPVVIADHYHEKDHMHMGLPGVSYVKNKMKLSEVLAKHLNDHEYYNSLRKEQLSCQPYFGKIDGQSTQRIIEFICTSTPCTSN